MIETVTSLWDQVRGIYVLPFLLAVVLHFLAEPLRWCFYVRRDGVPSYTLLLNIFSLTAFLSYMLPAKLGIPVRIMLLRSKAGLGVLKITGILVLDGLVFYALWGLLALAGLGVVSRELEVSRDFQVGAAVVLGALILVLAGIALLSRLRFGALLPRLRARFADRLSRLREVRSWLTARRMGAAVSVMGVDIASHVLRHVAMLAMLGHPLPLTTVAAIAIISIFAGLVSLMPMGLGGYDVTLVLLLTQADVPPEVGISVVVVNRLGAVAVSALLGVAGGYALGLNPFKRTWVAEAR